MSQYCTVTDIESYYLNKKFGCDGWISTGEVETFIIGESSYIEATLRSKYGLPITDQADLMMLKMICEKLVVATIDDITREKTADGKFERGRNTRKEAEALLEMIKNGKMTLNSSQGDSVITFNKNDSNGDEVEKRFKDSNIEPTVTTIDRERRRIVG